jgi:hypothetical protein
MMTTEDYLAALRAAGVTAQSNEADKQAGKLLKIDERTARRYRLGEIGVPGPVQVALRALGALRTLVAIRTDDQPRRGHRSPS